MRKVINTAGSPFCSVTSTDRFQLNWVFVKHHTIIFHGTDLMVDDPRYSFAIPPGSVFLIHVYFATQLCSVHNRLVKLQTVNIFNSSLAGAATSIISVMTNVFVFCRDKNDTCGSFRQ